MENSFFAPEKIYVDAEVRDTPLALKVLDHWKLIPVEVINNREDFLSRAARWEISAGKRNLWLTRFKGEFLKPCPGTAENYLCCRYWIINAQTHCPLDCSYCVLQGYLNNPVLTLYTNTEGITREIDGLLAGNPGRLFRIGTGELTDSLVFDPWTGLGGELIRHAESKIYMLELKTKTNFTGHLPEIGKGRSVISFSLNPEAVIAGEEHKTASVEERLRAACEAEARGYRLGFHFDPILETDNWEEKYAGLIRTLTEKIPQDEVTWISLGTLRYPPAFKAVMEKRFPKTRITSGEMVQGLDGKLRYFRPVRTGIYRKIYGFLREKWKDVFIYFCMENRDVWRDVMGFAPENNAHLDFLFHENLARRFPDMRLPRPNLCDYSKDPA